MRFQFQISVIYLDDVEPETGRGLDGVEVQHIAQRAVRERRTEDGDPIALRPVADGALVRDLLAEAVDQLKREQCVMVRESGSRLARVSASW